jgi:hypothetical protein
MLMLGVLTLSSCGSPAAPSAPVTESLGGLLQPTGLNVHPFTAGAAGDVSITLTTIDALPAASLGIGLGTFEGGSCNVQYSYAGFKVGTLWTTAVGNKGSYCLAVYDTGQVTVKVNYAIKLVHP